MKKVLLILLFSFLLAHTSDALSIGVKPTAINIFAPLGVSAKRELLIKNTSLEPALYKVYADNYGKNIKVSPGIVELAPGEEKVIAIETRFFTPGLKKTDISVLARSMNLAQFTASPGVKISLAVYVSVGYQAIIIFFLALFIILAIVYFVLRLKHKNKIWKKLEKKSV
jgi:hypothetical protein